jgi:hypothetical protein
MNGGNSTLSDGKSVPTFLVDVAKPPNNLPGVFPLV